MDEAERSGEVPGGALRSHAAEEGPSSWVRRFSLLIPDGGRVLDLAAGSGRHARWLAGQGYQVEAIDRDASSLAHLQGISGITVRVADLEQGSWPFDARRFEGIVVSRYLYRPRLALLADMLERNGVLIYETFMQGNERYGRPSNPDFLLQPDELMTVFSPRLKVLAFDQGEVSGPRPSVMQRICAYNAQ